MKVLFVTSEAVPFAASGGLGDVSAALPIALRKRVVGCRVVMPLYADIAQEWKDQMTFVTSFAVPVAWRRQYCGVFEAHIDGVVYYFLDNQYYFKRNGLYGHFDDAERFAFFARAVLEMLPRVEFKPDVIQANDWQSALVPVYFDLFYGRDAWYQNIKTLYTIHNIQYQGKYGMEILGDVFGIPEEKKSLVEYGGCINLMKGGIETAHGVNTVSPTYAQELLDPWYAYGLENILQERSWKITGILNGIDTVSYDPETDKAIYANYGVENRKAGKAENKRQLQAELGLEQRPEVPLIGMVTRLALQKGLELVQSIADRLMQDSNAQLVVLGTGAYEYEEYFQELQKRFPGRVCAYIGFVPALSRKIYAAADFFLMPSRSEPCGLAQMIALRYGTVPIVRETGGLKDSVWESEENGVGFVFPNFDAEDLYAAIWRGLHTYADAEKWDALTARAMACDNSWGQSAKTYMALYRKLMNPNATE